MLFGEKREDIREVFFRAWQRHQSSAPLEGVERMIVAVALRHPEYHGALADPAKYLDRDYTPETGQTNPFLHMAMHIAIDEQLTIDQPAGIRGYYQSLLARYDDEHHVQHVMMDCLAEMLWRAARAQAAPIEAHYLDCLAHAAGDPGAGARTAR